MYAAALALLLAAAPELAPAARSPAPPSPSAEPQGAGAADPVERRRAEVARELVALGARIQREIERGDVAAIAARVPEDGLQCAGRVVPRARVERDLRAQGSWLNRVLFGEGGTPGAPASLRTFFREAREVAVVVSFRKDPAADPAGRPCLDYRSPGLRTPGAPLCFRADRGRWWFTESLYPCG